ncbi:MAG: GNAT family N-acetyltransferase [Methylobacteriaceae bacterium]|nr:GNAT family N-acetyltransferase [Methylobacteriaceae bacterium]
MTEIDVRAATERDLDAVESLEEQAFTHDRSSRSSLRRFLFSRSCEFLVASLGERIAGYALILFRAGAAVARLYSIAIDARVGRRGIGRRLLGVCEAVAVERGCASLRLEVRPDNERAIALYLSAGYQSFGRHEAYYADGAPALRLQKPLWRSAAALPGDPPHFHQTKPFTSGPACIIMVLQWAGRHLDPGGDDELLLRKEMSRAEPASASEADRSLALAEVLRRRGLDPLVHLAEAKASPSERRLNLGHGPHEKGLWVMSSDLDEAELKRICDGHGLVLTLATRHFLDRGRRKRWVLVHRLEGGFVVFNDPLFAERPVDNTPSGRNRMLSLELFRRITLRGRTGLSVAIIVRKGSAS